MKKFDIDREINKENADLRNWKSLLLYTVIDSI